MSGKKLEILQNPVANQLTLLNVLNTNTISRLEIQEAEVYIFDPAGNPIEFNFEIDNRNINCNVSSLKKGPYVCVVYYNKQKYTGKYVKIK